jgi:hypothetical protein
MMTEKASEPRTLIKVPVSLREEIRKNAKKEHKTMMDYLTDIVKEKAEC